MKFNFKTIKGKGLEIIEAIMNCKETPEDTSLRFKIRLCSEEIVQNIINYAYGEDEEDWMEVCIDRKGDFLFLGFRDEGRAFNPLLKSDPDLSVPDSEREIGNLGIFLCKEICDDITYANTDGCNCLNLKIRISGQA